MPRPRAIQEAEAQPWLAVLLDYALSEKGVQMNAQLEMLDLAKVRTTDHEAMPDWLLASLLLKWSGRYVPADDWQRLQARVRKRRRPHDF